MIDKLLIKVFSKCNKKGAKTFTLRNIDTQTVCSCDKLKSEIVMQLESDVSGYFDVGYVKGASLVCIRSTRDLGDVWREILKGNNMTLWCDGLKEPQATSRKRTHAGPGSDDEFSEDESSSKKKKGKKSNQEGRQMKISEITKKLTECHGHRCSTVYGQR